MTGNEKACELGVKEALANARGYDRATIDKMLFKPNRSLKRPSPRKFATAKRTPWHARPKPIEDVPGQLYFWKDEP